MASLRRRAVLLASTAPAWGAAGCLSGSGQETLAELHRVPADLQEVRVEDGLDQAMAAYRAYLEEAPRSARTPEAMRRLADLKLEKQFGIYGQEGMTEEEPTAGGEARALPAPERTAVVPTGAPGPAAPAPAVLAPDAADPEPEREPEDTAASALAWNETPAPEDGAAVPPGAERIDWSGPEEAIELYDEILAAYPDYEHNDRVLYQKARAFDELGRVDEAIAVIERLVAEYPDSRFTDEVQFRRGEYFFTRRRYLDAEEAYLAVTALGPASLFYELALYKLGWSFYKQEMHEEALAQYLALLDHKVASGYDFDQSEDENDERRIADTFRVISLSFSSLGGPEVLAQYFGEHGARSYEDRIYGHLAEFYLEKLRYHDAASVYASFVDLHPYHLSSPRFGMRIVEIYETGGFPMLVLEAKKDFAARYGLDSEYWSHVAIEDSPEVLASLKTNLEDLATHYHAAYQASDDDPETAETSFQEALRWYGAILDSFPGDPETPGLHHQMADLLLEHEDFGRAAREYEHVAYAYPAHERSAEAGYAAVFAHRENLARASEEERPAVRSTAIESSLRFADTFPGHPKAPPTLAAAAQDLYETGRFEETVTVGSLLLERYPEAEADLRRSAWAAVAHASFDLARFVEAEEAYLEAVALSTEEDETRQGFVDNLAAAIYRQGEQAREAADFALAADHFLRLVEIAPGSGIRPAAEYDAGAALVELEDWKRAAAVFDGFRDSHPTHELAREATKQLAYVHREDGDPARAALEYERVAQEADEAELRRESMWLAAGLYEEAEDPARALAVYRAYVEAFPEPLEQAVEARFQVATIHASQGDAEAQRAELRRIVALERRAGDQRSDRVVHLAARAALVLAEVHYDRFAEVALVQPFERNLDRKRARMEAALGAFQGLVDYEVGEVTAAATYYIAEIYSHFSQSLLESERPADLSPKESLAYELVLEEEAFPFEERAIEVHEKNLELMSAGVYNPWIDKSLGRLGELMPGRYAKAEESPGVISSLDRYAYQAPAQPTPPAPEGPAEAEAEDEAAGGADERAAAAAEAA